MRVTDDPDAFDAGKASVLFAGGIHGNEAAGREMLARAAMTYAWARASPGTLPWDDRDRATEYAALVDAVDLWFVPSANPDGFEAGRRTNARGVDIDRDFRNAGLDRMGTASMSWIVGAGTGSEYRDPQPETAALMSLLSTVQFSLVVDVRGGALATTYPWNGPVVFSQGTVFEPIYDGALEKVLAGTYAGGHATMRRSKFFAGGIANAAGWFSAYRTFQDYAFAFAGAPVISPFIGDDKWPEATELAGVWTQNRDAIYDVLALARRIGARFQFVSDNTTAANVTGGYMFTEPLSDYPARRGDRRGVWHLGDGEMNPSVRAKLASVRNAVRRATAPANVRPSAEGRDVDSYSEELADIVLAYQEELALQAKPLVQFYGDVASALLLPGAYIVGVCAVGFQFSWAEFVIGAGQTSPLMLLNATLLPCTHECYSFLCGFM